MSGENDVGAGREPGELGVVSEDAAGGRLQVEVAGLDPVDEAVPGGERLDPLAWAKSDSRTGPARLSLQVDPSS